MSDLSVEDVKAELSRFLRGDPGPWDWDDFISVPIKDPYLDAIRIICRDLPERFPPEPGSGLYCSREGWHVLELVERELLPAGHGAARMRRGRESRAGGVVSMVIFQTLRFFVLFVYGAWAVKLSLDMASVEGTLFWLLSAALALFGLHEVLRRLDRALFASNLEVPSDQIGKP